MSGALDPPTRQVRVGRAVGASSVATLVALAAHVAVGGTPPPALAVVAVLVLSWLPAILLAGRRCTRTGISLVIVLAQTLFHLVFSLLAPHAVAVAISHPGMAGMSGMDGGRMSFSPMTAAVVPEPVMWLGHGFAAVVTIALWLRGEAALRALGEAAARLVWALVPLPVGTPELPGTSLAGPACGAPWQPAFVLLDGGLRRRGPPATPRHH